MSARRIQFGAEGEIVQQGNVDSLEDIVQANLQADNGVTAATELAVAQLQSQIAEFKAMPPGHRTPADEAQYEENMIAISDLSGVKAVNVNAENEAKRAAQHPITDAVHDDRIDVHNAKMADMYDTVQRAGMMKMAGQPLPKDTREHLVKTLMDINIIRSGLGYEMVTDVDFGLDQI